MLNHNMAVLALDPQSEALLNQLQPQVNNIHFSAVNEDTEIILVFTYLGQYFNPEKFSSCLSQYQEKFVFGVVIGESVSAEEQAVLATLRGYFLLEIPESSYKAGILLSVFDKMCAPPTEKGLMPFVDFSDIALLTANCSPVNMIQVSAEGQDAVASICSQLSGLISDQIKGLCVLVIANSSLELGQYGEILDVIFEQVPEGVVSMFDWIMVEDSQSSIQVLVFTGK
ncbi:MAG: hypothetical protein Q4A60_00360 [Pasteurellaceae bacterium]|nr:hypothetical protein [Pasteurellaceae bacterium]